MLFKESRKSLPNFKEKLENLENLKISQTQNLVKEILPNLTDDDYFLDKSDSIVYTYLMKDDVKYFFSYFILLKNFNFF